MREILFRGKMVDNGQWVFGYLFVGNQSTYILNKKAPCELDSQGLNVFSPKPVVPETVGQYTGLYDNTPYLKATEQQKQYAYRKAEINNTKAEHEWEGVMIFEGDFVLWDKPYDKNDLGLKFEVVWMPKKCGFGIRYRYACYGMQAGKHLEIVGNINDNPDMLK